MGGRGSASGFPSNAPAQPVDPVKRAIGNQGTPKTLNEAMALANPNYQQSRQNGDGLYTRNCQRCIWAVELLRRGYDVVAMPRTPDNTYASADGSNPNSFVNVGDPPLQFSRTIGNIWYKPKATDIKNEILKHPDGARGVLSMLKYGSGHVCNWEIVNGRVVIYDGQIGRKHYLSDLIKRGYYQFAVARMDNVGVTKLVQDFVKRR